jgi:hypothetical protein
MGHSKALARIFGVVSRFGFLAAARKSLSGHARCLNAPRDFVAISDAQNDGADA